MPLDPVFAGLVGSLPPLAEPAESPRAVRARFAELAANPTLALLAPEVADVADIEVDGADGPIGARVYRPTGDGPRPTVVFLHGGGFVIGSPDTHDGFCRELCARMDAVVVSVDYRLAPEHPFPAGARDCVAAARWVVDHVADFGGDADRIGVAGDSAGGTFTAIVSQELGSAVAAQLLIYPMTDVTRDYPSREECAAGYYLDQPALEFFAKAYLTDFAQLLDPRMSPIRHPDLAKLPPTLVVTAEFDPLRDQGAAYADALAAAGVDVTLRQFDGLIHGFIHFGPFVPSAQRAVEETCALFASALNGSSAR